MHLERGFCVRFPAGAGDEHFLGRVGSIDEPPAHISTFTKATMFKRTTSLGAAALLLATMLPSVADVPASGANDVAFAALAKAYFAANFAANPVNATGVGIHTYDAELGSYAAADYAAQLERDRSYLAKIEALGPDTLSPEVAIDAKMLANSLHDDLLLNGDLAQWQHNPDAYVNIASGGVYAIVERPYAPVATRARYAIARERAIPRLIAQAEANLTTVDATTAMLAERDARGSENFFTTTVPEALGPIADRKLRAELLAADTIAHDAIAGYATWLAAHPVAHPSGTFAIGERAYALRLKYEEGLDMPVAAYLRVGEDALADTHARFIATAKLVSPDATPAVAFESLKKVHPTAATLIPAAQHDLIALREFVIAKKLLTLPSDADIKVIETPVFQRQTTFASMDAPGVLEKTATRAFYNVTPVDLKSPIAKQNEFLGFLNDYNRPIVSAHEVYPGHYVNFTIDKHLPLSLTRQILSSSSFAEGWAHYDEQMIVDEGWGKGDPHVRLAQLGGALVRECRYIVGVKEHTAGMTVDEATKFFVENAFMAPGPARVEALRGTQDATYGYYTLGKLEILKLRADMQKKLGSEFTLQRFHDALLAHGDPPIPLLRPILLGTDDDGKLL